VLHLIGKRHEARIGYVRLRDKPILQSEVSPINYCATERRATPRIYGPFPAVALDADTCSQKFGVHTVLDNLGADGFYLRLAQQMELGEKLLVITQVSQAIIMLRGAVLRIEPQKDGAYGVAACIAQYRIFSLIEIGK
jgi:hypothetical protein